MNKPTHSNLTYYVTKHGLSLGKFVNGHLHQKSINSSEIRYHCFAEKTYLA